MKKSDLLKQERASKLDEIKVLLKLREDEKREFTDDEVTKFEKLEAEIRKLDEVTIPFEIRAEELQNRTAANKAAARAKKEVGQEGSFSLLRSLASIARGKELTGIDREVHDATCEDMKRQGMEVPDALAIAIPLADPNRAAEEKRAQTVLGDSGTKGGAFVSSVPQLVMPLQPHLPIADLGATIMPGLVGDVPLISSGTFSFAYVAETADVSATDVTMSGPTLKPKRCSGVVEMSKKLLNQTGFSIEAYVRALIESAYGQAVTKNAISGPGTDAPTGLYTLITSNINTTAGGMTWATVVDLESLIDAADAGGVKRGYLSDTKIRAISKTKLLDAGSGRFISDGKTLNGYNYLGSTLVDTLDAGASHPLIFGDWAQLFVGYWGAITIMVDPYTKASAGMIRLIIDGYSDMNAPNEKAFAINKVMTLA